MNKFIAIVFFISVTLFAQDRHSSVAGKAGTFSRMGFGARGMGMSNAMTAVDFGNLSAYYNPALSVFQQNNSFHTSYSFLSLDRSLNFLNFTKRFELGKKNPDGTNRATPRSVAGLSIGLINASVGNFAERDNQGIETGELSPYENQFFMGIGLKISQKLAIGFNAKFYYSKLYDEVTSTSFGFDIGAVYTVSDQVKVAATLTDLNSKYKWDTTKLYGQEGTNTEDKFPVRKKIALAYSIVEYKILASLEFEGIDGETNFLRFGAEYNIFENLFIRGGIDNINISNFDFPAKPSLGFSYVQGIGAVQAGLDYAFVIEPYSPYDQHIIGLNFIF
ncbi:MAG: hypothetical protein JW995_09285 [Melioribacteraceae bacterium]|nr:hypothetical protein [Melioribacteraceae bacterium]